MARKNKHTAKEVGLNPTALRLMSQEGIQNAYAELYKASQKPGLKRDQISCLTLQKQILQDFLALQKQSDEERRYKGLLKAHEETQKLLRAQQGSGVTRFNSDSVSKARRDNSGAPKN